MASYHRYTLNLLLFEMSKGVSSTVSWHPFGASNLAEQERMLHQPMPAMTNFIRGRIFHNSLVTVSDLGAVNIMQESAFIISIPLGQLLPQIFSLFKFLC